MTKKLLTLIHYSSNFVICMIFNSLLFICTKDSIGCASRLQMEIYRRGTSWQPHKSTRLWGALAEDPTNCPRWCCCALEERDLLAQASGICLWTPQTHAGFVYFFDFSKKFLKQTPQARMDAAAIRQMPGKWPLFFKKAQFSWWLVCATTSKLWTSRYGLVQKILMDTPLSLYCTWHAFNCQQVFGQHPLAVSS